MSAGNENKDVAISSLQAGAERFVVVGSSLSLPDSLSERLNEAERDICQKMLAGEATFSIAKSRGSSVHTVENQIQLLYAKLGVRSRWELMALRFQSTS